MFLDFRRVYIYIYSPSKRHKILYFYIFALYTPLSLQLLHFNHEMFSDIVANSGIHGAFKPLRSVAKLLGLAPYTFITDTRTGEETIDTSWKYNSSSMIWSILLLAVEIVATLYRIASSSIQKPESVSRFFTTSIHFTLVHISGLVPITLGLTTNRTKMVQLLKKLSSVDKELIRYGDNTYNRCKARIVISLVFCVIFVIPTYGSFVYCWESDGILGGVLLGIADFTWFSNDVVTVFAVLLLRDRVMVLRKGLGSSFLPELHSCETSDNIKMSRMYQVLTAKRAGSVPKFERLTFHLQHRDTQNLVSVQRGMSDNQSKVAVRIIALRKIYHKLYDICYLINSMYGFTLFLSTACLTVRFVSDVYNAIHLLIMPYGKKGGSIAKEGVVIFSISSIITAIRVILLALPCQKACEEQLKCVDNIEELLLRSNLKDVTSQLKLMAHQLQNNRIEITAYGFFFLKLSLLATLTGVTVTYVILLIQV